MLTRYEHRGLTWIDLESPTPQEVAQLAEEFGIDPLVAEELVLPSARPRSDLHEGYIYLVMHFPALRHTHRTLEQELDFIIGERFIITTRYDTIDPLHKFSKVFEVNTVLERSNIDEHAGFVFFYMLKKLYGSVEHELEYVRRDLTQIEEHVFSGHEMRMVENISKTARDLLNLRQTIEPHRDILHSLESDAAQLFGREFTPYIRGLSNEYYRVHNHVQRQTESLHELRETNNSLVSTKQNEVMKRFTILAFATFPLTLIAALFSMDTIHTPVVGAPHDFWIITGTMAFGTVLMFTYFKTKKWL